MHTKGDSSILDFIVVEKGSSMGTEVYVCAANIGSTDYCLIWTLKRVIKNRRGRKLNRWRIDQLEVK